MTPLLHFGNFKQLEAAINNCDIVQRDTYVRFLAKPIWLEILDNGATILHNGNSAYYDSPMGRYLKSCKLEGLLFISTDGPSKTAHRWIDRFCNTAVEEWNGSYHFYHIGDPKNHGDHHSPLPKITENIDRPEINRRYQDLYGDLWDGFLVVTVNRKKEVQYFRKLPSRTVPGTVRAFIYDSVRQHVTGAIVHSNLRGKEYTIKTGSVPKWLKDLGPRYQEYIGKHCIVNYTQFTPGDRVSNFASPRLISIR